MSILDAIKTRRSVRKFLPDPVKPEHINALLEAAMAAPSAGNSQPWRFVVIKDREKLVQFAKNDGYSEMASDAPLGILVCGDESVAKQRNRWVQGCSAAVENMLLAAYGLDYGAVWCGIYLDHEREHLMRGMCELPEHITPFAMVLVGKSAHPLPVMDRYDPHKVRQETWGSAD